MLHSSLSQLSQHNILFSFMILDTIYVPMHSQIIILDAALYLQSCLYFYQSNQPTIKIDDDSLLLCRLVISEFNMKFIISCHGRFGLSKQFIVLFHYHDELPSRSIYVCSFLLTILKQNVVFEVYNVKGLQTEIRLMKKIISQRFQILHMIC